MSVSTRPVHVVSCDESVPRRGRFLVRSVAGVAASTVGAAVLATVPAAPAPAAAHTTYLVRQHSRTCSDSGRGTRHRPFCSISAAARVADAGDTVRVGRGTYREQVTAPSGVRFVASRRSARILGSDSLASASWSPAGGTAWSTVLGDTTRVFRVFRGDTRLSRANGAARTGSDSWYLDAATHRLFVDLGGPAPGADDALVASVRQYGFVVRDVHGVTVKGFTLRAQGGAGILLDAATRSSVRRVTVTGSASYGINIQGGSKDRVIRAHVRHSASIGIRLLDTTSSLVNSSVSRSNGFHGISVQGGSGAHLAGNTTTGNRTPGIRRAAGIDVSSGSRNAVVQRNVSHDNDDSGLEIYTGSTGAVVRRNITYDNGDHGIDVSASASATLVSNTSVSNTASGLNVEGGSTGSKLRDNISVNDAVRSPRSKGGIRVDSASVSRTSIDHDLVFQSHHTTPLVEWAGVGYRHLHGLRRSTHQERHGHAADPRFVALRSRNLRLGARSPALDAADSRARGWVGKDRTGAHPFNVRRVRNTGVGPIRYADLGALERTPRRARHHRAHRVVGVGRIALVTRSSRRACAVRATQACW
jgi:hypothetical protein